MLETLLTMQKCHKRLAAYSAPRTAVLRNRADRYEDQSFYLFNSATGNSYRSRPVLRQRHRGVSALRTDRQALEAFWEPLPAPGFMTYSGW